MPIPSVEKFSPKLHTHAFANGGPLVDGDVLVMEAEASYIGYARSLTIVQVEIIGAFKSTTAEQRAFARIEIAFALSKRIGTGNTGRNATDPKLIRDVAVGGSKEKRSGRLGPEYRVESPSAQYLVKNAAVVHKTFPFTNGQVVYESH